MESKELKDICYENMWECQQCGELATLQRISRNQEYDKWLCQDCVDKIWRGEVDY